MPHKATVVVLLVMLMASVGMSACGGTSNVVTTGATAVTTYNADPAVLNIIAGSEQEKILNEIVVPWCRSHKLTCNYTLKGSVDQATLLAAGTSTYDVYWFASTVFLQVGDKAGKLQHVKPMFITPLVYAGWKSEMAKLGFVGRDVSISEILNAVESGKTTAWLTNPGQSNSGATVFFGFLNYFAGNGPGVALTMPQLDSAPVKDGITRFIRAMDQTPPSSGTLMNDCVKNEATCRSLFVYEALVIEKNLELTAQGHEPLYVVYPKESLAIADAPMGFFPHPGVENSRKDQAFQDLQSYLLSPEAQQKLVSLGRRPVSSIGLTFDHPDAKVFNQEWGIKATLRQRPITYPAADVIQAALARYQTSYRRPTHTIYCLDGSGSMASKGWSDLDQASKLIFDQAIATGYNLQTHPEDVTTVMIFDSAVVGGPWTVEGNDAQKLNGLYDNIHTFKPQDGTNMYACLKQAAQLFNQQANDSHKRLIIVMTDGRSDTDGASEAVGTITSMNIPIISIAFGDADPSQLKELADKTRGSVIVNTNLVDALRQATGYK
ncbi:MAG: VWA domain-containing protein [Herpetosiphonaceae bacterium]|nr:VWA domain-containing protein [Herpetosiphonaceae bacterium]